MKYFAIFIVMFCIGVTSTWFWRTTQVKKQQVITFTPDLASPVLSITKSALNFEVLKSTGELSLQRFDRDTKKTQVYNAAELQEKLGNKLSEGDELQTTASSEVTLNIPDLIEVYLEEKTKLTFINTQLPHLFFEQESGVVTYQKSSLLALQPVSVRLSKYLYESNGTVRIESKNSKGEVVFNQMVGTGKLSFLDSKNVTQYYTLETNQQLKISRAGKITLE